MSPHGSRGGTGPLGNPASGTSDGLVPARAYYSGMYYDTLDRVIASVNVGTNGGTTWTRPSSVPASSVTVLVTRDTYNPAGRLETQTDPRGVVTYHRYDNLGREDATIAAYTSGAPTADRNQTTLYGYDGSDHVTYVSSLLPGAFEQETSYLYGVRTATGSAFDSNDVLSAVQYPDPTTGAPSPAQQQTQTVNALGQVLTATDRNGTVHGYNYDVLGRLVSDAATALGAGVDGSVRRIEYGYNALGNVALLTSYDAVTGGSIVNQVQRAYNGLGQLTAEYQSNSGAVNTAYGLTVTSVGSGTNGSVTINSDGTLSYTPTPGTTATSDTFTYTISDGHGDTSTATIHVTLEH
jgi:YD repeat-containing protein